MLRNNKSRGQSHMLQLREFLAFFQQQSIKFRGSLAQQSPEGIVDVMGGLRFAIPELLNEQSLCCRC